VTKGMVTAFSTVIQTLENKAWSVINAVQLANHPMLGGPWDVLDRIGALVGAAPRAGRSDADYLAIIRLTIRVNRSNGKAEDIIQVTALIIAFAKYLEYYPAAFEVDTFGSATTASIVQALLTYLPKTRSAGVAGFLRYGIGAGPFIILGSRYGGVAGAGFASRYGGAALNELSALGAA
jgi:hypothetical protein